MYHPYRSSDTMAASRGDEGYRRLAARVIERAFRDLEAGDTSGSDREGAQAFLSGSPMLDHWCELAGLNPKRLVSYAQQADVRRRFQRRHSRLDRALPDPSVPFA